MIIDAFSGSGDWAFRHLSGSSVPEILSDIQYTDISKAIIAPLNGILYKNTEMANHLLFEEISRHSQRLYLSAVTNPAFPDWDHDLETAVREYNAVSVALFPNYHNYRLKDEAASSLIERLAGFGIPVVIPLRVDDERQHHWLMKVPPVDIGELADLIGKFPGQRFFITNAKYDEFLQLKETANHANNIYYGIAYINMPNDVFKMMVAEFGEDKILFNTWSPFLYRKPSIMKILHAGLPRQEQENIFFHNAVNLFSLKD